eukprot:c11287_g1_i1.p1 GENE.c11287_g1_i1~~c11287_g1_i1.p1  ORF type:complete len:314 (+),score=102.86 c11287_g1_i1:44-985(+)
MDRQRALPPPHDKAAANQADSDDSDDSGLSYSEDDQSWVSWFCSLKGNEFYVEVDEEYIRDDFNLTGLSSQVPYYDFALDVILDTDITDDSLTEDQHEMIESAAEMLYGLIHARYIISSRGMAAMREKYCAAEFGRCPRVYCYGFPVLPVGLSDIPCSNTIKIYCSKCQDIYYPKSSNHGSIDGAYFGTSFPHLFLQTYPELVGSEPTQKYVPRIFGFRVHNPAKQQHQQAAGSINNTSTNTTSTNKSGGPIAESGTVSQATALQAAAATTSSVPPPIPDIISNNINNIHALSSAAAATTAKREREDATSDSD